MTLPLRHRMAEVIASMPVDRQTETILQTLVEQRVLTLPVGMASLEIGEYLLLSTCLNDTFTQAKTSARRILRDPLAKWSYRTTPLGVIIAREASDWSAISTEARAGEIARFLAGMVVGESVLAPPHIDVRTRRGIPSKGAARKLLRDPRAEWTARTTNKGVRVTRVR